MGTGFTIDTPIKVARFGISSVISLVDDHLIEQMRSHYCAQTGVTYERITDKVQDHRALRITAYINLVDQIVQQQMAQMKRESFDEANDLCAYFELLDDASPLKQQYLRLTTLDAAERQRHECSLKDQLRAGSIDVNIMTKADRENAFQGEKLPREYSDAHAALRGFARSTVSGSLVFSAGLNPFLYSYAGQFEDFYAHNGGVPRKRIVLKVSDFRSASVQAKTLAKKGVWVSEYRIESGLNCGGHAFATTGKLLGPILEEFKVRRAELVDSLFVIYAAALAKDGREVPPAPLPVVVTAQGGVGTADEHRFLLRHYPLDSVGWGTPFLLVPDATTVDQETLLELTSPTKDVYLSDSSPLGVPFYTLHTSSAETERRARIEAKKPGSPCLNKHLAFNTEYGEPLCVASLRYQRKKLAELKSMGLTHEDLAARSEAVVEKACICRNLGDGALMKYGISIGRVKLAPAICPGPNIAFFSKVCTLREMVGHIYGRNSVLDETRRRPHVFANELKIYIDYLQRTISRIGERATAKDDEYFTEFAENLKSGTDYCIELASEITTTPVERAQFVSDMSALRERLETLAQLRQRARVHQTKTAEPSASQVS